MEEEEKPMCSACQSSRIEWDEIEGGDDYGDTPACRWKCLVHDMYVPHDYYCDKFDLPF